MSVNVGDAIIGVIKADPSTKDLVKSNIWAMFAPSSTPVDGPWIVMHRISGPRVGAMDGDGKLIYPRYQFDVSATAKSDADALRDALENNFNAATKAYLDAQGNEYDLTFFLAGSQETWDEPLRVFKNSIDFIIWINTEPNT